VWGDRLQDRMHGKNMYLLRVGVSKERKVTDHLLVAVLVALSALHHTVKHEHIPVRLALEHEDILRYSVVAVRGWRSLGTALPHEMRVCRVENTIYYLLRAVLLPMALEPHTLLSLWANLPDTRSSPRAAPPQLPTTNPVL
jgi:hypothetical protein